MGGPWCEHRVLVRTMRFRDVLREYWRMVWARPPLREEEYSGPLVCRRCGLVMPEDAGRGGLPVVLLALGLSAVVGCSHGLQETAFLDESGTYIVSRSLVSDRVTATQPHVSGVFACAQKLSSEYMAEVRSDGAPAQLVHALSADRAVSAGGLSGDWRSTDRHPVSGADFGGDARGLGSGQERGREGEEAVTMQTWLIGLFLVGMTCVLALLLGGLCCEARRGQDESDRMQTDLEDRR